MNKVDELIWEYLFKGHASCPILWSKRKWKQFLEEKVEDAILQLQDNEDMNLPDDY